jgi:hypothetical protein
MEVSGQLQAPAALSPGKEIPVPHRKLGVPQNRPGSYGEKKNLAPLRNRTQAVQPVARRYADWAVLAMKLLNFIFNILPAFVRLWEMQAQDFFFVRLPTQVMACRGS